MKNKLKRDKNKTMTNQVYEKLEDLIVFCKIEPGTILTELEISDMIGAGRTPVREALRLLANESLVSISRIGILITETSATTQLRLLEVRRSILHLCIDKAIVRLTELDKKDLKELIESVDEVDDVEFLYWLKKRHRILANCSKNPFIYEELKNVQGLSNRFWYFYAKKEDHKDGQRLHKQILEAVIKEDKDEAVKAVDELIDYLEEFVRIHSI
ncbi:MAG: GntR family transcriptional regulator [Arcobacter sp.]|nr:GntR family transcriptional regulator [Arcobacter sp.]